MAMRGSMIRVFLEWVRQELYTKGLPVMGSIV